MQSQVDQDGELYWLRGFIQSAQAEHLYNTLLEQLQWQEESIIFYGKPVLVPRLMCWYGDAGAVYSYSGVIHQPLPWHETLFDLKQQLQVTCKTRFNSVLANLYRDGADSVGWHADNEKELGKNPVIASLSLGEQRMFKMRHNKSKQVLSLDLQQGDLLIMRGVLQHHWQHCLPKTKREKTARINLTFRQIVG